MILTSQETHGRSAKREASADFLAASAAILVTRKSRLVEIHKRQVNAAKRPLKITRSQSVGLSRNGPYPSVSCLSLSFCVPLLMTVLGGWFSFCSVLVGLLR